MLRRVEEAGLGIAACRLPARDNRAGLLVELSVDLGVEAETGQPALDVATLSLVEADPIFGFLSRFGCFVGKAPRFYGCRHVVADGRARTGFAGICTDENSQDRQCEDQDAHGLF